MRVLLRAQPTRSAAERPVRHARRPLNRGAGASSGARRWGRRGSVDDDFRKRWAVSNSGPGEQPQEAVDRLQDEVAALRRSRRRLVEAADADRRAIERDLHDGVQQHLVALAVDLRRLAGLIDADPVAAQALVDEMTVNVRTAMAEATALARTDLSAAARGARPRQRHPVGGRAASGVTRRGRRAGGCRLSARDHHRRLLDLRRDAVVRVTPGREATVGVHRDAMAC